MTRRKILAAMDGSRQALEGVRYALGTLDLPEVKIVLFSVMSKVPEFFYDLGREPLFRRQIVEVRSWEKAVRDSFEKGMAEIRSMLNERNIPQSAIESEIRERKEGVARDIIREAGNGYDAVLVGRSGLSKFKDIILGSIAQKLLSGMTDTSLWVIGGRPELGKILLALDESEGSMRAVDHVAAMLNRSISQITLFHAIRGLSIFESTHEYPLSELDQEKSRIEAGKEMIEPVFKESVRRLTLSGFDRARIRTKIVTDASSRAGAIIEEARKGEYGTIVVGRRGLSKVQEFFMGRVSNKVVQAAKTQAVWVVN
ncbi:MAG: universal stress protein [Desulfobacteraceae bacterium]|nr:MAG: universal stress protein [Desulfobacteraceae bacterium]